MFIGVLNWGLGHAARSIPLIRVLQAKGCTVTIGSDGNALEMLEQAFPDCPLVELPPYAARYSRHGALMLKLATQLPRWMRAIKTEHEVVGQLIAQHHFDCIISDNRYGLWHPTVPTVLVTHQMNLNLPGRALRSTVNRRLHALVNRFGEVWIPDIEQEGESLAGRLSHGFAHPNAHFIGPLSRFTGPVEANSEYDTVCLVSGPEPQRTIFEQKLLEQLHRLDEKALLLRGIPGKVRTQHSGPVTIANHMETSQLHAILGGAQHIVARAGYSTIMDLVLLNKIALLVPTPGQPEQEYLTQFLERRNWFAFQSQKRMDLNAGLLTLQRCSPPNLALQPRELSEAVVRFLSKAGYEFSSSQIGVNSSRTLSP